MREYTEGDTAAWNWSPSIAYYDESKSKLKSASQSRRSDEEL